MAKLSFQPAKFVCCMISIKASWNLSLLLKCRNWQQMWSIVVSSEKGRALVPSHLHDRSVAQHLLNCCSKPKPSSIAETCLILINLVFTWCHMQMSPLCCGWTSLRNYGTHHFRFLLLWSPGSALTIDGTELMVRRLENTCMASKSPCSESLLWKHYLYAKMRIGLMLEQLFLYLIFLSIKESGCRAFFNSNGWSLLLFLLKASLSGWAPG